MRYRVEMTARSLRDLDMIFDYVQAGNSEHAARWFDGLEQAVLSLEEEPERGTVTRGLRGVRQILYGRRAGVYKILYAVRKRERLVTVLHIRHGAMEDLSE